MTSKETKLKRQEYLQAIIEKYTKTDPKLTERDIAEVIVLELGDISKLLKEIKKEVKRELIK